MKLIKKISYQCSAVVQSGEYLIDRWDNRQCEETNPYHLVHCVLCNQYFCLLFHWPKHDCTAIPIVNDYPSDVSDIGE